MTGPLSSSPSSPTYPTSATPTSMLFLPPPGQAHCHLCPCYSFCLRLPCLLEFLLKWCLLSGPTLLNPHPTPDLPSPLSCFIFLHRAYHHCVIYLLSVPHWDESSTRAGILSISFTRCTLGPKTISGYLYNLLTYQWFTNINFEIFSYNCKIRIKLKTQGLYTSPSLIFVQKYILRLLVSGLNLAKKLLHSQKKQWDLEHIDYYLKLLNLNGISLILPLCLLTPPCSAYLISCWILLILFLARLSSFPPPSFSLPPFSGLSHLSLAFLSLVIPHTAAGLIWKQSTCWATPLLNHIMAPNFLFIQVQMPQCYSRAQHTLYGPPSLHLCP